MSAPADVRQFARRGGRPACPFCGRLAGGCTRSQDRGKLRVRQYPCLCGAMCKSVETRLSPTNRTSVDTWTKAD